MKPQLHTERCRHVFILNILRHRGIDLTRHHLHAARYNLCRTYGVLVDTSEQQSSEGYKKTNEPTIT